MTQNKEYRTPEINATGKNAFSKPLEDLTPSENRKFILGKNLFHGTSNDSRSLESRGIGPLYNAISCGQCHINGGTSNPDSSPSFNVKTYNSNSPTKTDPYYGAQINTNSTTNYFKEAKIKILADGKFQLTDLALGEFHENTFTYPRISQKVIGQGLIEAIPDSFFIAKSDPQDKNKDGISGKIAYAYNIENKTEEIARFGTKATEVSVRSQTLKALFEDIGISNSLFGTGECSEPINCTLTPEATMQQEDYLVFYTRTIAPPRQKKQSKRAKDGQQIFNSIGCSSCHTPSIRLEKTDLVKNDYTYIHPYSDFLLHSMGQDLADPGTIDTRGADEFKTAPLWGLGLSKDVNGSLNLLHDGRAKTISQAIYLHGGEGLASRTNYQKLSNKDKKAIIAYLNTL